MKKTFTCKFFTVNSFGFSLLELIVYMGVFLVLITVITEIFLTILDTQLDATKTSSVDQNGRYILARLNYDIQHASSITTPASLGQTTNNLQIVIGGINYTYSVDSNGNLQITNNNGTDNLTGYDASASAVSFQRLGNSGGKNTIQISFTVAGRTVRKTIIEIKSFKTTIGTR